MFALNTTKRDDPEFVQIVSRILESAARLYSPKQIYVVQIDHWFDHKWKAFSGKVLGAVGVWNDRLTLPPFSPGRVMSQLHYEADASGDGGYTLGPAAPLHINQMSDANIQRFVNRNIKNGILVWYSCDTAAADAASVMLYRVKDERTEEWYASFKKKETWAVNKVEGISRREFSAMLEQSPSPHGI